MAARLIDGVIDVGLVLLVVCAVWSDRHRRGVERVLTVRIGSTEYQRFSVSSGQRVLTVTATNGPLFRGIWGCWSAGVGPYGLLVTTNYIP